MSEKMDDLSRNLLIDTIRFLDKTHPVDVNRYNTEAGALRYKVDRVLNHGETNMKFIIERLQLVQKNQALTLSVKEMKGG